MKRTLKTLAVLTIAACLILNIGEVSKRCAFAGSMAWVASIDPQIGALPVYSQGSANSGIVGSLPRCTQVALTGAEQGSWVEISQPVAGWVQSNLLSQNALFCSQRATEPIQPEPSVSVASVEPAEVESTIPVASYGFGPVIGFGVPGGWGPQGHWEAGHWVPGHMVGQHWVPGHMLGDHYIPGHWTGGHWVAGHYEQGHWELHSGQHAMHPTSLIKASNSNKLKPLALNKAKSLSKLKTTSINKQKLGTLAKINSNMKAKSGLQGASFKSASFKGSFARARR